MQVTALWAQVPAGTTTCSPSSRPGDEGRGRPPFRARGAGGADMVRLQQRALNTLLGLLTPPEAPSKAPQKCPLSPPHSTHTFHTIEPQLGPGPLAGMNFQTNG